MLSMVVDCFESSFSSITSSDSTAKSKWTSSGKESLATNSLTSASSERGTLPSDKVASAVECGMFVLTISDVSPATTWFSSIYCSVNSGNQL